MSTYGTQSGTGGGTAASAIVPAASNMTGTSLLTGATLFVGGMSTVSFQAIWTGTPVGTFSFEGSDDGGQDATAVSNWTTLTVPSSFSSGNPAGSASSFIFEFFPYTSRWVRIKYTNSSSTGTLTVNAQIKP